MPGPGLTHLWFLGASHRVCEPTERAPYVFFELNSTPGIRRSGSTEQHGLGLGSTASLDVSLSWPLISLVAMGKLLYLSDPASTSVHSSRGCGEVKRHAPFKVISTEEGTWWSGNETHCSQIMILIIYPYYSSPGTEAWPCSAGGRGQKIEANPHLKLLSQSKTMRRSHIDNHVWRRLPHSRPTQSVLSNKVSSDHPQ